jgi:hypothetical protein
VEARQGLSSSDVLDPSYAFAKPARARYLLIINAGTSELLSHPEGQIIESFRGRFLNHAGCLIACI